MAQETDAAGMQQRSETSAWSSDDTYRLLLVVVVVAAIWAFLALTGSRYLIYPDAMEYAQTARSLSEGQGAKTNTLWVLRTAYPLTLPPPDVRRPLLWPAILSGFFRLLGAADWVVTLASAFMGCLGAALLFVLARRFMEPLTAFVATLVFVFQSQVILMNQSGLSEPLFICVFLCVCLAGLWARRTWHYLILGLLLGLAQWIRLNGFLLAVPVGVWLLWQRKPGWPALLLATAAGFAAVVLPLALRNYQHLGEFSILNLARYSVVGEVPPFPDHGAERSLERISVFSVFAAQPRAVFVKYIQGLAKNLTSLFAAAHPVLWGLWLFPILRNRGQEEVSRLSRYGLAVLVLFWLSFSIGEFEGARFYVPLVPVVVLGGMVGLRSLLHSGEGDGGSCVAMWLRNWKAIALVLVLVLPGLFSLYQAAMTPNSSGGREKLEQDLTAIVPEGAVVGSDVPWAVGWYGQRLSIWLPTDPTLVDRLNEKLGIDIIVLSPSVRSGDWARTAWPSIYVGMNNLPGYRRVIIPEASSSGFVFFQKADSNEESATAQPMRE